MTIRQLRRHIAIAFAAVSFLAVCVATLTPSGGSDNTPDFWCFACGELGGLDVIANVIMFVPLGFALTLVFGRRRPAVLLCMATTFVVELLQVGVVPGRDASLSDLIANTLGGVLGTILASEWRVLIFPASRTARRLSIAWAIVVLVIVGGTSWGLGPAFVPKSLWVQRTPPRPSYDPFTGRLLAFDVEGVNLPDPYPDFGMRLDTILAQDTWTATAVVDTRGLQPNRSIIVRVAEEFTVLVWMDQVGWDLTCLQKTRSALLRLRSPKAAVVDGLRPTGVVADSTGAIARLSCSRRHGALDARAEAAGQVREYRLPLAPSLGWLLLSPFDVAFDPRYRIVSALWLIALLVPAGYWSAAVRTPSTGSVGSRRTTLGSVGFIAAGGALAIGLAVAPRVFGVAPAAWWEWAAGLSAIGVGAVLYRFVASATHTAHE